MKKSFYCFSVLVASTFAIGLSCGGGSSSSTTADSTSGSSVSLTGSIQAPVASTSISSPSLSSLKGISSKAITEAAVAGEEVHFYTLEGEHLGETTTKSDGTFDFSAVTADLKGSEDSATFVEPVICDCPDKGIQLYAEVSVVDGVTSSVAIGTATADTTLAAMAALKKMSGFDFDLLKAGSSFKSAAALVDLKCLFEVEKARWENASLASTTGLADDNGAIRETMMAFMASGKPPSDAGYTDFNDMFDEVLAGNASSKWSTITSYADDYIDSSYHAKIADYSSAYSAVGAFDTIFARDIAPISGAGNTAYSISKALSTTSICDDIKLGELDPDALLKVMYESDDVTKLGETFGADGMKVMFGLMEQCQVERTAAEVAAGAPTDPCKVFIDKPGAYFGYMNAGKSQFADVWDGSNFDTTALVGWSAVIHAIEGSTSEAMKDAAAGMFGSIYSNYDPVTGANWSDLMTNGMFDAAKIDTVAGYWIGQAASGAYDPESFDASGYGHAWSQFESTFASGGGTADDSMKSCVDALIAAGSYDTSSCYGNFDNVNQLDSNSGSQVQEYWQSGAGEQYIQDHYGQ